MEQLTRESEERGREGTEGVIPSSSEGNMAEHRDSQDSRCVCACVLVCVEMCNQDVSSAGLRPTMSYVVVWVGVALVWCTM